MISFDPLSGVINKTREQHDEREGPSEAPNSILTREDNTRHPPGSFGYRPVMSEISKIDVPDILPDLPNVAEDIMYDADLGPSIAPSLANVVLPTLPDMETSSIISEAPPSISDFSLPPPTPLPEPSDLEPPPPDNFIEFDSSNSSESEESTPANSPDTVDDRGALLRQIENFKKKDTLKPMQQRHERKIQKQKQVDESEDIMMQLKNRLHLRREGISGHKRERGAHIEKRESVLEQMSLLIPPSNIDNTEAILEDSGDGQWSD
ncbi:hypothetical protein LOD99_7306 [Oopsacas minuta]|uniref:WASH1 WAHD domain-containing protein n=1 Tax=Oopsacas minuta TaxID=111878 RepID=A0AAV7JUC7_9METZ|nr:hypothetical protein LOD99_7306 [Oopsacas minuta]